MLIPTVGSVVKVKTKYDQGPRMFPPKPDFEVYEGKVLPAHNWLNDRQFCLSGTARYPIRVMDMSNVLAIDLISGNLKSVATDLRTFTVKGSKGDTYVVTHGSRGWNCTCPGFAFRKKCKHVEEYSKK